MNREDLLTKCVDRGVADETSVGTVSHLFYVYLLSALQKGQRIEIPNFGTFGTRVVGVKRARKMPYFEVEKELADKVNDRYRELKYLVLGKYDLIPALGEEEYAGPDVPFEPGGDRLGKEILLDAHRDVTIEEYERSLAASKDEKTTKEKRLMPKLNLKDEGMEPETKPVLEEEAPPPTLHDSTPERGGPSALLQVLIALIILGALTFALNYFGVIHFWGTKPQQAVIQTMPEPEPEPPQVEPTPSPTVPEAATPTPVPVPKPEKPKPAPPVTSTGGNFTVQVSSWLTRSKANEEAQKLVNAGFDAYVVTASVGGETWHRVRIGHYGSEKEAAAAASQFQQMLEDGIWVARTGK